MSVGDSYVWCLMVLVARCARIQHVVVFTVVLVIVRFDVHVIHRPFLIEFLGVVIQLLSIYFLILGPIH